MNPLKDVTLVPFDVAGWMVRGSLMDAEASPSPVRIVTLACIIEHPDGVVVIDTGVDPSTIQRPPPSDDQAFLDCTPIVPRGTGLVEQLAATGLTPTDVRFVINTHLHLDHAGGNRSMPEATWLVRRAELEYAARPADERQAQEYPAGIADGTDSRWTAYDDDEVIDVFGDGSLTVVPTPGHSPGHQSVLVQLRSGAVLLPGDAVWTAAMRASTRLPGLLWDEAAYRSSRRRLDELATSTGARWLYPHEPELFSASGWVEGARVA